MNLDKIFKLKKNGTDVRTELTAGLTTFMTMAYILAINPGILSITGMDAGAVFTATALSAMIGTFCMALFSNYPFALAPGMGLNTYFAYTVVIHMGYSWQTALAAVFIEGIIFIILSLTHVREAIFNSIPIALKHAVSVGIGVYIAFIGLQSANVVVDSTNLVSIFSFKTSLSDGTFSSVGITVLLALIGILVTGFLVAKNVKGNILLGILITWGLGIICELTGIYTPDPALGAYSLLPDFSNGISVPSIAPTFMQLDFKGILSFDFFVVVFAFLFVDLFDTLGTLIGVAAKGNMLDKNGKLPNVKGALLADAVATSVGSVLGTSTVSTFVESSAGVSAGGRTGLTSITTGLLFGLSLFLSPIFLAVPAFATAPALVVVGFMMFSAVVKIPFDDITEAIPAYIAIIAMPFMYSISEGISLGIISYVIINIVTGNFKKKNINVLLCILAVLFTLKYIFI